MINENFIKGFYKTAMPKPSLGIKAMRAPVGNARQIGNHPTPGVTMASAAKNNPVPTASHPGPSAQSMAHQSGPIPTKKNVGGISL